MSKYLVLLTMFLSTILYAKNIVYDFNTTSLSHWHTYGSWKITQDKDQNILSMMKRSKGSYNLCYNTDVDFLDGVISVDFKANSGEIDQGGGLMWRVQDEDNYYVARFNPLEDNFRYYIVHHGWRSEIASARVHLSVGWHTMKVIQKGTNFTAYIDGVKYFDLEDEHLQQEGAVGVWSKADAHTSFDNLNIVLHKR